MRPPKSSPFLELFVPGRTLWAVHICVVRTVLCSPLHSCTQYVFARALRREGILYACPSWGMYACHIHPMACCPCSQLREGRFVQTFSNTCYTDSSRGNTFYCTIIFGFFPPVFSGCWCVQHSPMLRLANTLHHASLAEYFLHGDALSSVHLQRSVAARMFAIKIPKQKVNRVAVLVENIHRIFGGNTMHIEHITPPGF